MVKKKILVGFVLFMGFMWFCTLISKSIYATTIPMVSTTLLEEKYIEHKVEAEGIVIEGGKQAVTALQGLRVKALMVHVGDRVEVGDVLFQIDLEDLQEIIKERQTEINKVQLQANALSENQELARQRRAIEEARAREDYDTTARQKDTDIGRAADVYARAEEELEDTDGMSEEERRALQDALQSAAYGEADARRERDGAMKEAQRNIEDILFPEDKDASLSIAQTDIAQMKSELSLYQEMYDNQGYVTAKTAGMITDIYVDVGDRVPDTAAMMMTDDELPCQLKVILDQEQKKYVGFGDEVSVRLDGKSREMDMTIDYFSESKSIPGSFETFINLPEGTGVPGLSGTLSRSEKGEKYRSCIPPSAIYTEKNGRSYVYVLKEREGILGPEYYVEEATVRVLDQNDDWAAVESAVLNSESRIILSADKEFSKGDTVRWAE